MDKNLLPPIQPAPCLRDRSHLREVSRCTHTMHAFSAKRFCIQDFGKTSIMYCAFLAHQYFLYKIVAARFTTKRILSLEKPIEPSHDDGSEPLITPRFAEKEEKKLRLCIAAVSRDHLPDVASLKCGSSELLSIVHFGIPAGAQAHNTKQDAIAIHAALSMNTKLRALHTGAENLILPPISYRSLPFLMT